MSTENHLVVGTLDTQRYAFHLSVVERIIQAVEVTSLPLAPEIVLGVVDVRGQVIPVVNMRRRLHLPERAIEPSDRFIIAQTAKRPVLVVMDNVVGVVEYAASDVTEAGTIVPTMEHVAGVAKLADGMIFIHDLDTFLSLDEEQALGEALASA